MPVWGREGECKPHLFSLTVCMGQTHACCKLVCFSDCCSMHKHIYPRDGCPCAAKPLSRKVKFTSFSPLSIFHNPSYTIHAIHQPSQKDSPSTCSSSPGSWIGWLWGGGWRTAAASIAVLILHSRHLGLSDCRQGRGRMQTCHHNKGGSLWQRHY